MRKVYCLAVILSFLIASFGMSCTYLKVSKYKEADTYEGALYYLPKSEFHVTVSNVLQQCPYIIKMKKEEWRLYLKVKTKIAVTSQSVADLSNTYLIEYRELESMTKKFDFDLQYHPNGMIKSINTSADDQTAEIAIALAKVAATVALVQGVGPAGLLAIPTLLPQETKTRGNVETISVCSKKVQIALENIDSQKKNVAVKLTEIKRKINEIKLLRKSIEEATENAPSIKDLERSLKELTQLHAELEGLNQEYNDSLDILTVEKTFKFATTDQIVLSPKEESLEKWFRDDMSQILIGQRYLTDAAKILSVSFEIPELRENMEINVNYSIKDGKPYQFKRPTMPVNGIVYRQAVLVDAQITRKDSDENVETLWKDRINLVDAGPIAVLPFVNKAFQENHFSATFSESGMLNSVKYSSNAPAEEASAALGEIAEEYSKYKIQRAQIKEAEKKADNQETVDSLNNQIELIKKQKELSDLTKVEDKELSDLKYNLELQKLLKEIDTMDIERARLELERLTIEKEIIELMDN